MHAKRATSTKKSSAKKPATPRATPRARGRDDSRGPSTAGRGVSTGSVRSYRSATSVGSSRSARDANPDSRSVGSEHEEVATALRGRHRVQKIVSDRAKEREDRTLNQLADYGSDDDKTSGLKGAKVEDEHVLTAENILRTSPVYDLHRTIMSASEVSVCTFQLRIIPIMR